MPTIKYFNDVVELVGIRPVDNKIFENLGGIKSKHNYYDGYQRFVGKVKSSDSILLPVTRKIEYKSCPSLHKCDARCQNSKGHICECSCGGMYHGINS